ncbi:MAG: hypothetical protein Pars2KO_33080 [Parasphingorhabdus sp.]
MNIVLLFGGLGLALLIWFLVERIRRRTHPVVGGIDRTKNLPHHQEVELYSNSFSHCSRKSRLVMAELDLSYRHHAIELIETGWYQTISPAYLKINPAGLVPTLVHQGHPVYESDDILAYAQSLAGHDAPQLVPEEAKQKRQMEQWLDFCAIVSDDPMGAMKSSAGSCIPGLTLPLFFTAIRYTPLRKILVGFLFHPDKKRPAMFTAAKLLGPQRMMNLKPVGEIMLASRDHMARHLVTLNEAIEASKGEWILGDNYSLADISIGCLLLRLEETCWLAHFRQVLNIDALLEYYVAVQSRPSWQAAITAHAHPHIDQAQQDLAALVSGNPELQELLYNEDEKAW